MKDSYRLSIFDETSNEDVVKNKKAIDEQSKASSVNNKYDANANTPNTIVNKDKHSSSVDLNRLNNNPDIYKSKNIVVNNSDSFTEKNAESYSVANIENVNTYDSVNSYENISDVATSDKTNVPNEKNIYSFINDVVSQDSSFNSKVLYSTIKETIENIIDKNSVGNNNTSSNSIDYKDIKDDVTSSSVDGSFGDGIGVNPSMPNSYLLQRPSAYAASLNTPANEISSYNQGAYNYRDVSDVNMLYLQGSSDYSDVSEVNSSYSGPMTEIESICYPDAMSNMYDVYFRIRDDNGYDSRLLNDGQSFVKALFSSTLLSARITSIDVPSFQRKSETINYASGVVERPLDGIDTPGRSSFSIRGDTKLAYISAFNEISGTSMSNLFGKGSAIVQGLQDSTLAKIQSDYESKMTDIIKKQNLLDEDYLKDWDKALDNDSKIIIENFTSDKDDSFNTYFKNKANSYMKTNNGDLSGFYTKLRDEMQKDIENHIEDTKNKIINEVTSTSDSVTFFANLKNKIATNQLLQKEIESYNEDLGKLYIDSYDKYRKNCTDTYNAKLADIRKEKESINNSVLSQVNNLHFEKEGLNYITESLSKNISIISKPASANDLFNVLNTAKRLDIIVKRTTPSSKFRTKITDKTDERFIFEDVKILGTSDPIKFERENAEPINFNYEFIYKRFYKLDTYDDTKSWVKSQVNAFINNTLSKVHKSSV